MKNSLLLFLTLITVNTGLTQDSTYVLLSQFEKGWEQNWIEREYGVAPTEYQVIAEEDSNLILEGYSDGTSSTLWRPLNIVPGPRGKISWRWKIDNALSDKTKEKTKLGDDYAVRLWLVFEPHVVSWKTSAICYVWSASQPVGSKYRSPYAASAAIIVLQSGDDNEGDWMVEERDYVDDYREVFNRSPELISAVAITVDTDNTKQESIAWIDDLVMTVTGKEKKSTKEERPTTIRY